MRNQRFDILRGVAVLAVLFHHTSPLWLVPGWVKSFIDVWIRAGWAGVDLFFVLSGFLVSGLLFDEFKRQGRIRPLYFLVRRGLKIYPGFYFCLGIATAFAVIGKQVSWPSVLHDAVFLTNYLGGSLPHFWSISVEEHFYLLLALYCFWMSMGTEKDPFRRLPQAFLVVAVASLLCRIYITWTQPYTHMTHNWPTHIRMDSLGFGVLLSYAFTFHRSKMDLWLKNRLGELTVLSLILVSTAFVFSLTNSRFMVTFGYTCLYLGFGGWLCVAIYMKPLAVWGGDGFAKTLSYIGRHSYAIYLWHIPFKIYACAAFIKFLNGNSSTGNALILFYLIGSIAAGVFFTYLIEVPFLRWRDRVFPNRARGAVPIGTAEKNGAPLLNPPEKIAALR